MPRTFAEFYKEVEEGRSLLVDASIWLVSRGSSEESKRLSAIVGQLVGWCEDYLPGGD